MYTIRDRVQSSSNLVCRNLSKSKNTTNKRRGIYCLPLKGCRTKTGNWPLHWQLPMKETVPFLRTVSFLPFFVASYSLAFSFFLLFASFTITQLLLLRPQNPTSKLNSSTDYSQSWRNSVAKSRN